MDSETFHKGVVEAFREAMSEADFDRNPFAWEGLPASIERLFRNCMADAVKPDEWAGPSWVSVDRSNEDGEAMIYLEIAPFEDSDEYASLYRPLSDALIQYNENGDKGWMLARQIKAIEKSLDMAKAKATALGWDLSQ